MNTNKFIKMRNEEMKKVRARKKELEIALAEYMERTHVQEYKGIKLARIKLKPKVSRITEKRRREETMMRLREEGVPNPEGVYEEIISRIRVGKQ